MAEPTDDGKGSAPDTSNSDKQGVKGNPLPPEPSNEPPKVEPTEEEKAALAAAEKEAAETKATKDAADKAAADKQEQSDKDKTPLDHEVWGTTGHEGADAALGLLQNAGVTPDEAKGLLFDAVSSGDLSKVDWKAVEAKVGADKTKLVRIGAESFLKDTADRNTAIIKEVATVAGSKENWDTAAAWAKANLDDGVLGEYKMMIDSGGAQARFAAGEIVSAYNADAGNTSLTKDTTEPEDGDTTPGQSGEAIDRNEYAQRMAKLHQRGRVPAAAEIEKLNAARARGRKQGV